MSNTINKSKILSISNDVDEKYVTSKKAMQKLGVSIVTLRTWASNGLIETIRTGGNHRLYNVDKYLKDCIKKNIIEKDIEEIDNNKLNKKSHLELKKKSNINNDNNKEIDNNSDSNSDIETSIIKYKDKTILNNKKENICYIRTTSLNEIDYLNKQKKYMNKYYPNHRIIEDIGSSIDLNRKGLQEIINILLNNQLDTLVIMNKNILSSIGYDFLFNLFSKYNSTIMIETNKYKNTNDIIYDMQTVLNYYIKNGGVIEDDEVVKGVNLDLKLNKLSVINDLSNFKSGVI